MKTTFKRLSIASLFLLATSALLTISSCKKDSDSTNSITEEDAAELTTNAVTSSTGGFSAQVSSNVEVYQTTSLSCGVQKEMTLTKSSVAGAVPAYNYSLKWNYMLTCNGIAPAQLTGNFTGSSTYDGLRMSSNDNSSGSFTLTGFTASAYNLSTTYNRVGSQTSKIGRNNTFTSDITIKSTNVAVDKTTRQIISGSGTVAITGASTSGKSFSFGGTITFLGGNKATIVLNSGLSYTISW